MNNTADVIIIGGGIVGCATAYYLAKSGTKNVIVLESTKSIGHGGSCRNGGGVRQSGRDVRELPYAMYGIKHLWPTLSEELGVDVEYTQKGNLRLGKTEEHLKKLKTLADNAKKAGLGVEMVDAKEVQAKVDEMNASRQAPAEEEKKDDEPVIDIEPKEEITFDDFEKMQFQVGEIIACEEVKKSKKLLCSQVKIGSQVKQIVSGIKKHYSAEAMVGKKVMVLVNLKPAKLAGVLSEGMLLCAEDENGELSLMVPEKKMPAGAEIC